MKDTILFCFAFMTFSYCIAQERPRPNLEPEILYFDTLHIHFQQNFENDRVILFANGVKIYDGTLYSSITMGTAKQANKLPYLTDTIRFTYIFFEKDHHWSLEEESVYFDYKKIEFEVVPKEDGKYLGLFVYWDIDKGSVYDEKRKRAINVFPDYTMSKIPFVYY